MSTKEILLTIKLQQQLFVDPKRIRLLKAINKTGSINQGAKFAKVSYKSAWDHLEMMNRISPKPLLARNTGGRKGGGTALTTYAHRLLALYQLLEDTQKTAFDMLQNEDIPLDNPLFATSLFSLQTSARNQFFGKIVEIKEEKGHHYIGINIVDNMRPLFAQITPQSTERLQLTLGKDVLFLIKAPAITLHTSPISTHYNLFQASVKEIENGHISLILNNSNQTLHATLPNQSTKFDLNETLYFHIDPEQIIIATLP